MARESANDEVVAAALCNLGSGAGEVRRYPTAERWLRATIDWCAERDLDTNHVYSLAWLARVQFERGEWSPALRSATQVMRSGTGYVPAIIVALTVLGRLRARRGDPDPGAPLDEAWELASLTGDLQRTWPVAAGRAEAAYLRGDAHAIPGLVREVFDLAVTLGHAWAIGELGYWLWRAGALEDPPATAPGPYAAQIAGRPGAAAAAWRDLGCPYEAAVALADGGPDDLATAYEELGRLGAWPAAGSVARQLRELGHRRLAPLPRRRTTMDNPAQLTGRQLEVLRLICAGLRNEDIGLRLHISSKTVAHHVSAILAKLGVTSRGEARTAAERLLS